MARTAQICKEKRQSIITWRHEGQSIRNILRTCSHEDRHRNERPRVTPAADVSSLELPASEIVAKINASQSSSNRHISRTTVQGRLRESGLHCRFTAKKPILTDTNNKKRLAWAKKHEQWTLDWGKSVLWSGVQFGDFWFQPPCLCETRCEWTDDLRMCGFHREAWRRCDGVGVLCW